MSLETNKETNNAMDVDDDPTPNKIIMEEIQEKVDNNNSNNNNNNSETNGKESLPVETSTTTDNAIVTNEENDSNDVTIEESSITNDSETVDTTKTSNQTVPPSIKLPPESPAPQQQSQPLPVAGLNTKKKVKESTKTSIGAAFLIQTERAEPAGKKYNGVSFMYKIGRWRATLWIRGGKTKQLGVYKTAKKAALVYDKAARAEYGSNAKVNFDKDGQPTDLVTFAYGGLHGEHQTVEITPNTKWPRVGDEFQVDLTKALSTKDTTKADEANGTSSSSSSNSWHNHPIRNPDDDDNAGYVDSHYGSLHQDPLPHDSETNISKLWTPVEKQEFERAIFEVDKDFHLISKYVGTKSYRSCVEYYYCVWKLMRGCQKWKKQRDEVIVKFQQDEQKRLTDLNRITTPGRTIHGNKMNGVAEEYQRMLIAEAEKKKGNADGSNSNGNAENGDGKNSPISLADDPERYCLCRGPGVGMMVACEKCESWFHGACVGLGIAEDRLKDGDEFVCGSCTTSGFPEFSSKNEDGVTRTTISLANNLTVMWNSMTKSPLPTEECPKVKNLVKFLQNNPDYRPYYGESDDEEEQNEDDGDDEKEEEQEEEKDQGVDDVWKKMLRCPPYEKKEGPGVKKSRARTKILKFCKRLEPWIEFNSSSDESESSSEESSEEESSEEESSDEESSGEDDEEIARYNEYLERISELENGYDLLPLTLSPRMQRQQQQQQMLQQQQRNAHAHAMQMQQQQQLMMQQQQRKSNGKANNNADGSSVFSDRFLVARQQVLQGLQQQHAEQGKQQQGGAKRGRKRQREVPIVPRSSLPQGHEPWHRFAPWNGGKVGQASKMEKREAVVRVKTLVERIQAHRMAVAVGSDKLKLQRRRIERLHGKPRVKRIKTGSDGARTFTPKQFQTLMWQLWVTNNFIKKNQVPPAYAMHEAGGTGRQYRWSGLRCRSIGLIDGAIVASSPRNFEVYKSQIIDLPLNTFNMPPADINTLMQT